MIRTVFPRMSTSCSSPSAGTVTACQATSVQRLALCGSASTAASKAPEHHAAMAATKYGTHLDLIFSYVSSLAARLSSDQLSLRHEPQERFDLDDSIRGLFRHACKGWVASATTTYKNFVR